MRRNAGKMISTKQSPFYKIKLELLSDKNNGQNALLQAQVTNLYSFNSKLLCGLAGLFYLQTGCQARDRKLQTVSAMIKERIINAHLLPFQLLNFCCGLERF